MLSYYKVVAGMPPGIKETIDTLVNQYDIPRLKKWLADCIQEISFRETQGKDTYALWCEKYYLQLRLGSDNQ